MSYTPSPSAASALESVLNHSLLQEFDGPVDRDLVVAAASQYWYPISRFPEFLGRAVAAAEDLRTQNAVASILWQEIGEGRAEDSHTQLFVDTFGLAGIEPEQICECPQTAETAHLMDVYSQATSSRAGALGALYATEAIDLSIVTALGNGLRQHVPADFDLPWVDIHVAQEPSHTEQSDMAASETIASRDMPEFERVATEMWQAWANFYDTIPNAVPVKM